ncbi:MAG: hypothetical protein FD155_44 [Bacteroidetes bacterium]|nr:MAG: hypothetical protein FD155_44 [Bacteroidota bacterium]
MKHFLLYLAVIKICVKLNNTTIHFMFVLIGTLLNIIVDIKIYYNERFKFYDVAGAFCSTLYFKRLQKFISFNL